MHTIDSLVPCATTAPTSRNPLAANGLARPIPLLLAAGRSSLPSLRGLATAGLSPAGVCLALGASRLPAGLARSLLTQANCFSLLLTQGKPLKL